MIKRELIENTVNLIIAIVFINKMKMTRIIQRTGFTIDDSKY